MSKPFIDCVIPYLLAHSTHVLPQYAGAVSLPPKDMDYITALTVKPQTFFVPGLDKTLLLYKHLKSKETD